MHWIVQNNLINPNDLATLRAHLERTETPHTLVKLIPIFNLLDETDDGPVPSIDGSVVVYGSTSLGTIAAQRGWTPGYWGANLDHEAYVKGLGSLMLNHDAEVGTLEGIEHRWDRFFLRPALDTKAFAGEVMTWDDLVNLRTNVQALDGEPDVTLRPQDRVVMAPLKTVYAEYRFFVVDGRLVARSRYKQHDRLAVSPEVPAHVSAFADACVQRWQPSRAFAIDVAETDEGLRVVEFNAMNSAGFYACDIGAIVDTVNAMDL